MYISQIESLRYNYYYINIILSFLLQTGSFPNLQRHGQNALIWISQPPSSKEVSSILEQQSTHQNTRIQNHAHPH